MNITVDDTNGDPYTNLLPSYAPFNAWTTVSGSCTAPCPDIGHVSGGTWHATTQTQDTSDSTPHTVILTFNGTAAYVYAVLDNNVASYTTRTDLVFFLDGSQVGTYTHEPDGSGTYVYNATVYSNSSMPDGSHVLTMSTVTAGGASRALFDSMVYTQSVSDSSLLPTPSTMSPPSGDATPSAAASSSPSPPAGASSGAIVPIVVGVVVGLVLLAALVLAAVLLRNRRRRQRDLAGARTAGPGAGPAIVVSAPRPAPAPRLTLSTSSPLSRAFVAPLTPGLGAAFAPASAGSGGGGGYDHEYEYGGADLDEKRRRPHSAVSFASTASFYPQTEMFVSPTEEPVPRLPPAIAVRRGAYDPHTREFHQLSPQ